MPSIGRVAGGEADAYKMPEMPRTCRREWGLCPRTSFQSWTQAAPQAAT